MTQVSITNFFYLIVIVLKRNRRLWILDIILCGIEIDIRKRDRETILKVYSYGTILIAVKDYDTNIGYNTFLTFLELLKLTKVLRSSDTRHPVEYLEIVIHILIDDEGEFEVVIC